MRPFLPLTSPDLPIVHSPHILHAIGDAAEAMSHNSNIVGDVRRAPRLRGG